MVEVVSTQWRGATHHHPARRRDQGHVCARPDTAGVVRRLPGDNSPRRVPAAELHQGRLIGGRPHGTPGDQAVRLIHPSTTCQSPKTQQDRERGDELTARVFARPGGHFYQPWVRFCEAIFLASAVCSGLNAPIDRSVIFANATTCAFVEQSNVRQCLTELPDIHARTGELRERLQATSSPSCVFGAGSTSDILNV